MLMTSISVQRLLVESIFQKIKVKAKYYKLVLIYRVFQSVFNFASRRQTYFYVPHVVANVLT